MEKRELENIFLGKDKDSKRFFFFVKIVAHSFSGAIMLLEKLASNWSESSSIYSRTMQTVFHRAAHKANRLFTLMTCCRCACSREPQPDVNSSCYFLCRPVVFQTDPLLLQENFKHEAAAGNVWLASCSDITKLQYTWKLLVNSTEAHIWNIWTGIRSNTTQHSQLEYTKVLGADHFLHTWKRKPPL